jgi:hypothetical protein
VQQERPFRLLPILLVVLAGVVLLPVFLFGWRRPGPAERSPRRLGKDTAYFLVGDAKYVVRDSDGDGRADCLVETGIGRWIGGVYQADGADCRKRLGSPKPMSAELRNVLSLLLEEKHRGDLAEVSPRDDDGDGTADCLVTVHNSKAAVALRTPTSCASLKRDTAATMTAEDVAAASVVMRHEDQARRMLKPAS